MRIWNAYKKSKFPLVFYHFKSSTDKIAFAKCFSEYNLVCLNAISTVSKLVGEVACDVRTS